MNEPHFVWRPPYPSENLKTSRFAKTYSTTNPYATPEEPQQQQQQQSQQSHEQSHEQSQQSHLTPMHNQFQDAQHSKRENSSDKIYERGLTPQVGMNPFLQGNYLQDLETQNQFLKPLNSSLN